MFYVSTLLMKNKCSPLCNPTAIGDITFLGRRQSSTLIIIYCSSCRYKENFRMTSIISGPHGCIISTSTSSIKHEVPIESLIASTNPQSGYSPLCYTLAATRPMNGPTSMRQTLTSPPPTKCWKQTQWSLISIFRMGCCVV